MAESENGEAEGAQTPAEPVIIKKYANRRLYNTATSAYVTLELLSDMVRAGVDFLVQDAKTGEDITRSVLTQIIFEQESRGQSLLPVQFLRRLIRCYGDQMQGLLPPFLDMSMENFTNSQDQMRETFTRSFGASPPLAAFEEQARQNMALFQRSLQMWSPFPAPKSGQPEAAGAKDDPLTDLRARMEAMQKQLEALAASNKP